METAVGETLGTGNVPACKQKEKTMAKETVILTIAAITAMPLEARYKFYKENVVIPFKAIETAKDRATDSLHNGAKIHASLKREYVALLAKGTLTAGTSEREFFEKHCGGKPAPRVLAVSTFFNAMCMTLVEVVVTDKDGKPVLEPALDLEGKPIMKDGKPAMKQSTVQKSLLDETTQFDPHSGNALEIASACIAHERKAKPDGWMSTDNTLDVISALSKPGDASTKLKKIRATQKGTKDGDTESAGTNPPHTIDSCLDFLKNAILNGGAILKGERGEEITANFFKATYYDMGNLWGKSGVSEEMMAKWIANIENHVAPTMEIIKETTSAGDDNTAADTAEEVNESDLQPA